MASEMMESKFDVSEILQQDDSSVTVWKFLYVSSKRSLLLFVPGVCDPFSKNVLVNPAHEEAAALKITSVSPFRCDKRLHNIKTKKT